MKWEILFDINGKINKLNLLEEETNKSEFWNDSSKSSIVLKEIKALKDKIEKYNKVKTLLEDTDVLIDLGNEGNDESVVPDVRHNMKLLEKELEKLEIDNLLAGKNDNSNAIITIHPGAGGTEAQDWAEMLYRMYSMWSDKNGYKLEELDYLEGDGAGIKSVTFSVNGSNAYGYLKGENGVHRLVRISPFDAGGRRHTSFASIEVIPEIDDSIEIEINPEDLRVDTYRSSGAGGQHINKGHLSTSHISVRRF